MQLDLSAAQRAISAYNRGTYKAGRRNVDVDAEAYRRFRTGLAADTDQLTEQLRFVGDDFGGAQARFLPHSIREEARLLAANLASAAEGANSYAQSAAPLSSSLPDQTFIRDFFQAFVGTRRWGVWASKTLHFMRPDTFPILDSRAKKALGVPNLGSWIADYHRYCALYRDCLATNEHCLSALRPLDEGSPSDLKLLDKVLYEIGR